MRVCRADKNRLWLRTSAFQQLDWLGRTKHECSIAERYLAVTMGAKTAAARSAEVTVSASGYLAARAAGIPKVDRAWRNADGGASASIRIYVNHIPFKGH